MFWQAEKGGLRCGHSSKKGGLIGASPTRKRGVLGAGQVKKGVFTAAHTCTEHICEYPPKISSNLKGHT